MHQFCYIPPRAGLLSSVSFNGESAVLLTCRHAGAVKSRRKRRAAALQDKTVFNTAKAPCKIEAGEAVQLRSPSCAPRILRIWTTVLLQQVPRFKARVFGNLSKTLCLCSNHTQRYEMRQVEAVQLRSPSWGLTGVEDSAWPENNRRCGWGADRTRQRRI